MPLIGANAIDNDFAGFSLNAIDNGAPLSMLLLLGPTPDEYVFRALRCICQDASSVTSFFSAFIICTLRNRFTYSLMQTYSDHDSRNMS